jgi:hypothetical protein
MPRIGVVAIGLRDSELPIIRVLDFPLGDSLRSLGNLNKLAED